MSDASDTASSTLSLSFVAVSSLVLFLILGFGVALFMGYFCGRDNEYTEIVDCGDLADLEEQTITTDHETTSTEVTPPAEVMKAARKAPLFSKKVVPTPVTEQSPADVLAQEIDYFVRHMENFYPTGFYCSVAVLENHLSTGDRLKTKAIRDFLKRRPEFRMRSNMTSFKLTTLTPFREPDVQVSGKFQCVNATCRHHWRSLCSYCDHFQKCRMCNAHVYPYEQSVLSEQEVAQYLRDPMDENFSEASDAVYARKRDVVDISTARPLQSGHSHSRSGYSVTSTSSTQ